MPLPVEPPKDPKVGAKRPYIVVISPPDDIGKEILNRLCDSIALLESLSSPPGGFQPSRDQAEPDGFFGSIVAQR
jgi:hypothetical protein